MDYSPDLYQDLDPGHDDAADGPAPRAEMDESFDTSMAERCGFPDHAPKPPDVRWRKARRIAKPGFLPDEERDPLVLAAADYARRRNACRAEGDFARLAAAYPALDAAHAIYAGGDRLTRGALEGCLLTDQPFDDVARSCGLTPDAVRAYHDCFFDVRGRLGQFAWVVGEVIGPKFHGGTTEADADVLLKRAGYNGGVPLLERVLEYLTDGCPVPASLDGVGVSDLKLLRRRLDTRFLVLGWTLPEAQLDRVCFLVHLLSELDVLIAALEAGAPMGGAVQSGWRAWRDGVSAGCTGKGFKTAAARAKAARGRGGVSEGRPCPGKSAEASGTTTGSCGSRTGAAAAGTSAAGRRRNSPRP